MNSLQLTIKRSMQNNFLIALAVIILISSGCENSTDGGDPGAKAIKGTIKNSSGNLLSDVSIYIIYNFDEATVINKPNAGKNILELKGIILESFYAEVNYPDQVILHWSTSYELNNYGFEIQEKQDNDYNTIGFVSGAGTTDSNSSYTFTTTIETGIYYDYRLKIIEFDGSFEFSSELQVGLFFPNESALHQNYPNPFDISSNFIFTLRKPSLVKFDIYSFHNKLIISDLWSDSLSPGTYQRSEKFSELIPSNAYRMVMYIDEYGDSVYNFEKIFLISYQYIDTLMKKNIPNAVSANGAFAIQYDDIPFNFEFVRTTESDPSPIGLYRVNNDIILVLYKPGYKMFVKEIIVDQTKESNIDFVMENE